MATITEDYVSFETAKLLKEKGFLKVVDLRMTQNLSFYDNIGLSHNLNKYYDRLIQDKIDFVVAPTQSMAIKWLRLTHKIYIQAFAPVYDMDCSELGVTYNVIITNLANQCLAFDTPLENIEYNSPEEAHEAALKYCLENLI